MPELVIERLMDNFSNGLGLLAFAILDGDRATVDRALVVLHQNGLADTSDFLRAIRSENTRMFGRMYERLEIQDTMIRAIAIEQTNILVAIREGLAGMHIAIESLRADMAHEVQA